MNKPKVLITNKLVPSEGLNILREKCELVIMDNTTIPPKKDILKKVQGVNAIFWAIDRPLDRDMIEAAGPDLKVVGTLSAGVNHIDLDELKRRNIPLGNVVGVSSDSVAEVGVLLMLAATRRLHDGRRAIENGEWKCWSVQWMLSPDIRGSTVGIVGLGGIGQAIVSRLKGFGVKEFLYTGPKEKPEGKQLGIKYVSFESLVENSDFVFIACPCTQDTNNMFNKSVFEKMKRTAVLINISRGRIIDQDALIEALETNKIFAAGLDVMEPEPIPTDHKLLSLRNCVLTPHLGSATVKTRIEMSIITAKNILAVLNGNKVKTPVFSVSN